MKTLLITCIILTFIFLYSCKNRGKTVSEDEVIVLPSTDSITCYKQGNILTENTIILKDYNVFTYINTSCATCLPKLETLNDLHAKTKKKENVTFYTLAYSEDNFELLKFLIEDKRIAPPQFNILLIEGQLRNNPAMIHKLNRTFVTDKNSKIIYRINILDTPSNITQLLKELRL